LIQADEMVAQEPWQRTLCAPALSQCRWNKFNRLAVRPHLLAVPQDALAVIWLFCWLLPGCF